MVVEPLRPAPARQVEAWLSAQDGAVVYFTAVVEAELRHGVATLSAGKERVALAKAIDGILGEDFRDPIPAFDSQAARACAANAAERRRAPPSAAPLVAPSASSIARSPR